MPRKDARQRDANSCRRTGDHGDRAQACHIYTMPARSYCAEVNLRTLLRYSRNLLGGKSRENTGCSMNFFGSKVQNWLTCGYVLMMVLVSFPSTRATLRM